MEHPEKEIVGVVKALCQGNPQEQQKAVNDHFLPEASFVHPFCQVPSFTDMDVPVLGTVNSRTFLLAIFKWYKMLSPRIDIEIESAIFNQQTNKMYLEISQTFAIWFVPFYRAPVHLTTVLDLVQCRMTEDGKILDRQPGAQGPNGKRRSNDEPSYAAVAAAPTNGKGKKGKGRGVTVPDDTAIQLGLTRYMIAKQEDLYQVNEFVKFVVPGVGAPAWALWQVFSTLMCAIGVMVCWPVMALLGQTTTNLSQEDKDKTKA